MKGLVLAAGRGERLRPLTDRTPKPMLMVAGKPLITWQLEAMARAGLREVVINLAHLGHQIEDALGDGRALGLQLQYSHEPPGALEAAGGIRLALPLLGDAPFVLANADVWTDFDFASLPAEPAGLAHLVLVPNPPHHPLGDFGLAGDAVTLADAQRRTYAGLGVYRPEMFRHLEAGARAPLAPLLREAITAGRVTGTPFDGIWVDVGTPERLDEVNRLAATRNGESLENHPKII